MWELTGVGVRPPVNVFNPLVVPVFDLGSDVLKCLQNYGAIYYLTRSISCAQHA